MPNMYMSLRDDSFNSYVFAFDIDTITVTRTIPLTLPNTLLSGGAIDGAGILYVAYENLTDGIGLIRIDFDNSVTYDFGLPALVTAAGTAIVASPRSVRLVDGALHVGMTVFYPTGEMEKGRVAVLDLNGTLVDTYDVATPWWSEPGTPAYTFNRQAHNGELMYYVGAYDAHVRRWDKNTDTNLSGFSSSFAPDYTGFDGIDLLSDGRVVSTYQQETGPEEVGIIVFGADGTEQSVWGIRYPGQGPTPPNFAVSSFHDVAVDLNGKIWCGDYNPSGGTSGTPIWVIDPDTGDGRLDPYRFFAPGSRNFGVYGLWSDLLPLTEFASGPHRLYWWTKE